VLRCARDTWNEIDFERHVDDVHFNPVKSSW
jgi:REP element-mobilizing transposase RayT